VIPSASAPNGSTSQARFRPRIFLWPAQPGIPLNKAFPYGYIVQCVDRSPKNLKFEAFDLMLFHVWNPEWNGQDAWKRAIDDVKGAGKVRHFGISINDCQPESALDTLSLGLIDTVQVIYNIFDPRARSSCFRGATTSTSA
jgi:aryl-alcohol dehydrogenase-like predicted oxidoreductase